MSKKSKSINILKSVVTIVLVAMLALDIFAGNYLVSFALSRS